jgi:hypothetical protein
MLSTGLSSGYAPTIGIFQHFALRFPRVLKIHDDRIFKDAVSFKELQEMARRCIEMPDDSEEEEMDWLERMGSFGDLTEESEFSSSKGLNSGSVTVTRMME